MAARAPLRDVVRVLELEGPRGGQLRVLVLSCGCYMTRAAGKSPPPKSARCVACFVAEALKRPHCSGCSDDCNCRCGSHYCGCACHAATSASPSAP